MIDEKPPENSTALLRLEVFCAPGRKYKSIENLVWENIPPFSVITGLNGSGKTQLLELMAFRLTGTRPHPEGILNGVNLKLEGDVFPPESVSYLPSRWEMTSDVHISIPQMQQAKDQLWSELQQNHAHDMKTNVRRARIRSLVGSEGLTQSTFNERLSDDYSFMLEDNDVVAGLGHVLMAYRLRVAEELERDMPRAAIREKLGPAPWDVINEAFAAADFPYAVASPAGTPIAGTYKLELVSRLTEDRIRPGDLSSGEKMLLVVVLWLYNSQHHGKFPKLLLLDEPDANLHPSMARQFLSVLKEVLVEKYGVRVMLTTHSPSTVALAPAGSVFEMSRTSPRIRPSISSAATIGLLTSGLVVVSAGSRFVLVEDEQDVSFYQLIRDLLSDYGPSRDPRAIKAAPSVVFLAASRGEGIKKVGGGSSVVTSWVSKFDQPPLSEIIKGVIDRDESNSPTDRIQVLGRYSIENYLLDPLVVYCLLLSAGRAPAISGVEISSGDEHLIRELSIADLTSVSTFVANLVEPHLGELKAAEKMPENVTFTNGKVVPYPSWILRRRGHDLLPIFQKAFGGVGLISPPRLERSMRRLRLIPVELAEIFDQLQR